MKGEQVGFVFLIAGEVGFIQLNNRRSNAMQEIIFICDKKKKNYSIYLLHACVRDKMLIFLNEFYLVY